MSHIRIYTQIHIVLYSGRGSNSQNHSRHRNSGTLYCTSTHTAKERNLEGSLSTAASLSNYLLGFGAYGARVGVAYYPQI